MREKKKNSLKNDGLQIVPGSLDRIKAFRETLDAVAREKKYLEMIEAPTLAKLKEFQRKQLLKNLPVYYAVDLDAIDGKKVVGWIDVHTADNPRLAHRGFIGMGVLKAYRGRGVGSRLMEAAIEHARQVKIEKIELTVYDVNLAAIALYKKFGFKQIGYIKNYRKLGAKYFHCLEMELNLL